MANGHPYIDEKFTAPTKRKKIRRVGQVDVAAVYQAEISRRG
jgi:hypothetical protein